MHTVQYMYEVQNKACFNICRIPYKYPVNMGH